MNVLWKPIRTTVALLGILMVARPVLAPGPVGPIRFTPGKELAADESYWLAPYTLYTMRGIGSFREARVQWFTPEGKLEHEIDAVCADVESQGFVSRYDSSGTTYTSVANPRWEIFQRVRSDTEKGPYGLVEWSPDGRIFVRSSRGTEQQDEWPRLATTFEMFVDGKRNAWTYSGAPREIHLDPSGALAVHFLDGQLIVADRNGHERFREMVPVSSERRLLGCNDHGILIGDFDETRPIEYHGFDGGHSSFTIPGGYFALWVGGDLALFSTTLDSLLLLDCPKGRVIWRRHQDGERIVSGSQAYAVVGSYLVAAAAELGPPSSQPGWPSVRLRALDLRTGKPVASWSCGGAIRDCARPPRFFEREGKTLFLYASRLSELDPEDIRESRQGWYSSEPPKPAPPR